MRANEFLLEYNRSAEQQRIEAIPAYSARIKADPDFSLERLETLDPTPQKMYVPRLVTWWLRGSSMQVLRNFSDLLIKFHQLKLSGRLTPEHRDIGAYSFLNQFRDVMMEYPDPDSESDDRGEYKEIVRNSSLLVIQILDQTAAKFWGRNSRWCTAAVSNNKFNDYYEKGPLFVIIPRKPTMPGEKYQYWFNRDNHYETEFNNVLNGNVKPESLSFFPQLVKIFSHISTHIVWHLENPSPDIQLKAVEANPELLKHIKNPTEDAQIRAVSRMGSTIQYITNPSRKIQMTALGVDGRAIQYIENPCEEAQLLAVSDTGFYIKYIQNPSEAVQLAAVVKNGLSIDYINNPSEAVQIAAVRRNADALQYIKKPSYQVTREALQQDGRAIKHILNPSPALCYLAIKQYPILIFDLINKGQATPRMIQLAVSRNGRLYGDLIHYKDISLTDKIKMAAVEAYWPAIAYMDNPSKELQIAAVTSYPHALRYIETPCDEAQIIAIHKDPEMIKWTTSPPSPKVAREIERTKNQQQASS